MFGWEKINTLPTERLIHQLDEWLHNFFTERLKSTESKDQLNVKKRKRRPHPGLIRLRKAKKDLKRARSALRKAGLKDTLAYSSLTKKWRSLIREHNRLRVRLQKQNTSKQKQAANRRFKANPYKYAEKLFNGTAKKGTPTFSKEEAEKYFADTYRDSQRDHKYSPWVNGTPKHTNPYLLHKTSNFT